MFRSRPPADHVAHVRLTADDLSKLAEFCVRSERTQSEVLRALIRGLDIAMAEAHRVDADCVPLPIPRRPRRRLIEPIDPRFASPFLYSRQWHVCRAGPSTEHPAR
jgi:hypothetical protein